MVVYRSGILLWWRKTHRLQFWTPTHHWPTAIIRPKSQNSNIRHNGILSLGNFSMMIKIHFARPTTKKCAPYFRGNTELPLYFLFNNFEFFSFLTFNKITTQLGNVTFDFQKNFMYFVVWTEHLLKFFDS
jgi:hypothetical protein